jgi:hypothetical protein
MQYRVTWEIDLDAGSFEEAARTALAIQRDPTSTATCFTIVDEDGKSHDVDLAPIGDPEGGASS